MSNRLLGSIALVLCVLAIAFDATSKAMSVVIDLTILSVVMFIIFRLMTGKDKK